MWFKRTPEKILAQKSARDSLNELVRRLDPRRGFHELSPPEQILFMLDQLQAETHNGGIDQYLSNSSGDNFANALVALNEIGAHQCAALMREVQNMFPEGKPAPNRAERNRQMDHLKAQNPNYEDWENQITHQLDSSFTTMRAALVSYLKTHVSEIK